MTYHQFPFIRNLIHDALDKGRLTFTVLSYKRYFFTTVDSQCDIVEYYVVAISLFHSFTNHRIVSRTHGRCKLQTKRRSIFFVDFNRHNLFQLLDAALYLHSFGSLIAETFDKVFCIFYFFLLILVRTELLLATFLAQHHKLVVCNLVIVDMSAGNLNCAVSDIVDESTVVTYQHDCTRTDFEEILQPLDTFNIEVVGRLVEQQYIRTTQQQLRQLDTHTPSATELGSRTVEIAPTETKPGQCTLYLSLIIGSSHHQEAFIIVCKTFYQLMITFRIVIGTICQLLIHTRNTILQFEYMLKSHLGLSHHRTRITQNHYLWQITDSHSTLYGYYPLGRLLEACQNFQHSRLSGTILSNQRNTVFLINHKRDILKQRCHSKLNFQSFY